MKLIAGLLLLSLMVTSCSKNENTLLDNIHISGAVNQIDEITGDDEIIAWIDSTNAIKGFGGGYSFYTSDYFESVSLNPGNLEGKVVYNDFSTIITKSITNDGNSTLLIKESNDFGQSYSVLFSKEKDEMRDDPWGNNIDVGNHKFGEVFIINKNKGYFFTNYRCTFCSYMQSGVIFYAINNGFTKRLSSLPKDYFAVDSYFIDEDNGWLLVTDYDGYNTYVYKTINGGRDWEGPFDVSNHYKLSEIYALNENKVIAFRKGGYNYVEHKVFVSEDGGENWEDINCGCGKILEVEFVNEQIGYLVSEEDEDNIASVSNIYKTTDGGYHWEKINTHKIYADHIDFKDENTGIATSKNVVQITHDGGKNWDLLIYPYNNINN